MKFFYRAMPIDADNIRPGDYLTPSRKFAIEHAITTAIYHGEDYGVSIIFLDEGEVEPANNPGEFRYSGSEPKRARLVGIAKYDDASANAEYMKVSSANDKVLELAQQLNKLGLEKESFFCYNLGLKNDKR